MKSRAISIDLYKELQLTNAELRTGISREMALRNLGERTGVQNVKALVGLMIQSDRMGASIVQALRTHASFLRVQRSQKAEEQAAKLPVKILFPLLLFIFPAIFVVVLGPAAIQMSKTFLLFAGHLSREEARWRLISPSSTAYGMQPTCRPLHPGADKPVSD